MWTRTSGCRYERMMAVGAFIASHATLCWTIGSNIGGMSSTALRTHAEAQCVAGGTGQPRPSSSRDGRSSERCYGEILDWTSEGWQISGGRWRQTPVSDTFGKWCSREAPAVGDVNRH